MPVALAQCKVCNEADYAKMNIGGILLMFICFITNMLLCIPLLLAFAIITIILIAVAIKLKRATG
jgi:hypothetical protein